MHCRYVQLYMNLSIFILTGVIDKKVFGHRIILQRFQVTHQICTWTAMNDPQNPSPEKNQPDLMRRHWVRGILRDILPVCMSFLLKFEG